jgi:D-3-phosphoglycerate dehydrogenase / 2-oxoglutarate reductase
MNLLLIKILEPKNFSANAIARLGILGKVEFSHDVTKKCEYTEVLFVRLGYQLNAEFLMNYPRLRCIVSPTTGEDHVDKSYLESNNISLLTLKGETKFLETIPATAEFTWGLLLSLTRNISNATKAVVDGEWNRDNHKGNDIYGKVIGLVGFGRIAKIVTRFAKAFGMHVKVYDPYVKRFSNDVEVCDTLDSLIRNSDILSIHTALTHETVNLIGINELRLLPKHAVVINTARGDILDAEALLEVLKKGLISGAAIDVVPGERCIKHHLREELLQYAKVENNLLITPHLAGASYQSMAMTEEFMVEKLIKYMGNC